MIVYPDSLGSNLRELGDFLRANLKGVITGVHILPFYPSSGDRGFAPIDYFRVSDEFGTWEDLKGISDNFEVTADFMLNHISSSSEFFQDYLKKGSSSEYADLFLRYSKIWPGGDPPREDLEKIYTRKPRAPFIEIELPEGIREKIWCTFDEDQIDLNLESPKARDIIARYIRFLCGKGIRVLRLDAFAYTTKKPGTRCFFNEPEVWEHLEFIRNITAPFNVQLLPEVHEHYSMQLALAQRGYWVYDFALPLLVLQGLYSGTARNLKNWLRLAPKNQFTTLDTHDGIGVVDAADLLTEQEIKETCENLYTKGANVKPVYNSGEYGNLDIYQLNCTYFSALGNREDDYILARAIQFFAPGIPQVYYVGLLAGENDIELLEKTRIGRNINRHNYSLPEAETRLMEPVVKRLFDLMRFRNSSPAFEGDIQIIETEDSLLEIIRTQGGYSAELSADLKNKSFTITHRTPNPDKDFYRRNF